MTDVAWKAGYRELLIAFPYPSLDARAARERERLYREHLGHVGDRQWRAVVREAIDGESERTFPPVAVLLDYARGVPSDMLALPAPARTPAQLEADRAACRKGLELVKAAVAKAGAQTLRVSESEKPAKVVHASAERIAALKEQARQIMADEQVEAVK